MRLPLSKLVAALAATIALSAPASAQIKVALDSPPDLQGSGSYVWAHTFVEHLNANGLKAEEFQRGALGGDDELFDQVSQGLLEVSMSPLNITGSLDNLIYGLRLPYFFADIGEVDRALYKGGMLAKVNEGTASRGVGVRGASAVGRAPGFFTSRRAGGRVEGRRALRVRPLEEGQIKLWGGGGAGGPIVTGAGGPTALRPGGAEGSLTPPVVPLLFGHTDFLKFFTDAEVSPSLRATIVSEEWYKGLSDADRKIVDDATEAANKANRDWLAAQASVYGKLEAAGVKITKLSPEARAGFQKASEPTYTSNLLSAEQIEAWRKAKSE